jgi:hypothetical protein
VRAKQTHYLIPVYPMAAVLAGVWLERWRGHRPRAPGRLVPAVLAVVVLAEGVLAGHVIPRWNADFSRRPFLERVAARVPADAPLASSILGSHSEHLWYLRRTVTALQGPDLAAFLAGPGPRFALAFKAEADALGDGAVVLDRDPAFQKKDRDVVLVANPEGARGR